jgi:hypothetical protein
MSATAKEKLLAHLDLQDGGRCLQRRGVRSSSADSSRRFVENVYAAPLDTLDKVVGRWDTDFAHFGGKHSAGKPKVHDSDLKLQSFNRFPAAPIRRHAHLPRDFANRQRLQQRHRLHLQRRLTPAAC